VVDVIYMKAFAGKCSSEPGIDRATVWNGAHLAVEWGSNP